MVLTAAGDYRELLARIQVTIRPRTYVEIGVHTGGTFRLMCPGTRGVGIDPRPQIRHAINRGARIFAETSDEFFARHDLTAELGGPVDLAFIDGLHVFEYALRDLANLERHAGPDATILVHDCYPIDAASAERERRTARWSGDVWRLIVALRRFRPDLSVTTVAAAPTGLGIIRGLDPSNTVLLDRYDEIVAELLALPYSDIEARREEELAAIPNDWSRIRPLLPAEPFLTEDEAAAGRRWVTPAILYHRARRATARSSVGPTIRRARRRLRRRVAGVIGGRGGRGGASDGGGGYYADPQRYWDERHRRHAGSLEGVGCIGAGADTNADAYAAKWEHVGALLERFPPERFPELLDAGCGNGFFTARALAAGYRVTGVDFAPAAVRQAQAAAPGAELHVGALDRFEVGRRFGVVMCIDVLFHVTDDATWAAAVANLARLVDDGGVLVVQEHFDDPSGAPAGVEHVRRRTLDDYRAVLTGWEVVAHDHYLVRGTQRSKDLVAFRRRQAAPGASADGG
jgi:2-polyprenyl-3-methyl-5-hydroxy-6-metoxy-1,4-benzoquinol methylase